MPVSPTIAITAGNVLTLAAYVGRSAKTSARFLASKRRIPHCSRWAISAS